MSDLFEPLAQAISTCRADVSENEKEFILSFELPGFKKEVGRGPPVSRRRNARRGPCRAVLFSTRVRNAPLPQDIHVELDAREHHTIRISADRSSERKEEVRNRSMSHCPFLLTSGALEAFRGDAIDIDANSKKKKKKI